MSFYGRGLSSKPVARSRVGHRPAEPSLLLSDIVATAMDHLEWADDILADADIPEVRVTVPRPR
jgi:hypothetical protein